VLEKLYKRSSFTASDLPSFRCQEVFILLSVGLLAVLLLAQSTFSYWGRPSRGLLLLLIAVFVIDVLELVWVQGLKTELSFRTLTLLTWGSIASNLAAASQAVQSLTQYEFPGNIRELKNLIERAYVLSGREELGPESFPMPRPPEMLIPALPANGQAPAALRAAASLPVEPFDLTEFLEKTEKELILRALGSTSGAQAEAARRMGLSRSTLAYKLNKYGIRAIGD
jgi:hypothetical protein